MVKVVLIDAKVKNPHEGRSIQIPRGATTALKFKGIPDVIASSFSETYKRNAFNNGFVVFECPELVTHLRAIPRLRDAPTTVAPEITIDYGKSTLTIDGNHSLSHRSALRLKS